MNKRMAGVLITGMATVAVLLGVAIASAFGGVRAVSAAPRHTALAEGYRSSSPGIHTDTRSRRRLGVKVLGYKHAPGQEAAIRATAARSYMRRVSRMKANRQLLRNFVILRQERTHPTAHAASADNETTVVAAISGLIPLGATYGADPSQAGETTVGSAQDKVWLVPGSAGACLVNMEGPQGAGSTCNPTSAVDEGDLWTLDTIPYGVDDARAQVLLGAAPDGNAAVVVSWTDGGTTTVPVRDNVYCVPIGSHAGWQSVTLKNSMGTTVTISGMSSLP